MARKKCPREGTRLKFDANPTSAMMYSPPIPARGEVGTVVSIPLPGAGRKTCTGGHSQDLVYVDWPSVGVMGVARSDVEKAKGKGPRSMQVNGGDPTILPDPRRVLLRHYENAWRSYARAAKTGGDVHQSARAATRIATAAIQGGVTTDQLQEIRNRVQAELTAGTFEGFGEGLAEEFTAASLSVGQRVRTPHGDGVVRSAARSHVGVQLDDGSFVALAPHEVQRADTRQRFFNGQV